MYRDKEVFRKFNILEKNNKLSDLEAKKALTISEVLEGKFNVVSMRPSFSYIKVLEKRLEDQSDFIQYFILNDKLELKLIDGENVVLSVVKSKDKANRYVAFHLSSKNGLKNRKEFISNKGSSFFERIKNKITGNKDLIDRFNELLEKKKELYVDNPMFEGVKVGKNSLVFEKLIQNGRLKSLESGDVEEVMKFFLPDSILKGTKDASYLYGDNIKKYFKDFLKLNPKGRIISKEEYRDKNVIVVGGNYNFELDGPKGSRIVKPAQFLFVLKKDQNTGRWGIKLLHSSFKS